jgi:hypothetical protein
MSLVNLPNPGLWFPGTPLLHSGNGSPGYTMSNLTLDAATEKVVCVGRLWLADRGSSKAFSSAGAKIYWQSGSPTVFANAATNLRIGLQDMDAADTSIPGQPDGTFDVYDDLVGATDTITSTTTQTTTMSSGSKTLSHGDLIAVVFDLTARGGVDSVLVQGVATTTATFPWIGLFTASWAVQNMAPNIALEMDDGTLGLLDGTFPIFHSSGNTVTFGSVSSPNEYGIIFQVPFNCKIDAVRMVCAHNNGSADAEVILYSDPLGTPAAMHTYTIDASFQQNSVNRPQVYPFGAEIELQANTDYAVTYKPTTATSISLGRWDINTGPDTLLQLIGGPNLRQGSRASGAFTESTSFVPWIDVRISSVHDGTGGGGSSTDGRVFRL